MTTSIDIILGFLKQAGFTDTTFAPEDMNYRVKCVKCGVRLSISRFEVLAAIKHKKLNCPNCNKQSFADSVRATPNPHPELDAFAVITSVLRPLDKEQQAKVVTSVVQALGLVLPPPVAANNITEQEAGKPLKIKRNNKVGAAVYGKSETLPNYSAVT